MTETTSTAPNGDLPLLSQQKEIKRKVRVMVMGAGEFAESRDMLLKRPNWRIL